MTVTQRALDADDLLARSRRYVLQPWATQASWDPLVFTAAEGCYLWDGAGKRYLDFSAQMTNVSVGHQHPRVVEAIVEQARRLCYLAPVHANELAPRLGELIAEVTPGGLVQSFFTVGGSEANEVAIQFARMVTGRYKVISRWRSYHGATYGALSISGGTARLSAGPGIPGAVHALWQDCYRCPFGQTYPGCGLECVEHIEQIVQLEGPDQIAAIIAEPFVGLVDDPPPEYWPRLREICDRHGILLIADEVITGFGRTGEWFGCDHFGIAPDIMTIAKGMNSGYAAVGATVVSERIADFFRERPINFGFTSGGQPLGLAACVAVIETIKAEGLVENARRLGDLLATELARLAEWHPSIGHVHGRGLWWFIELVRDRRTKAPLGATLAPSNVLAPGPLEEIRRFLLERGLLALVGGSTLRIQPPLSITEAQLREGLALVDEALSLADAATAAGRA
jgi:taurine--2-oxoglutarate transaminase